MLRNFDTHRIRPAQSLNGWWDFTLADDTPRAAKPPRDYDRSLHVPAAWETQPGLETYRGQAWLRTAIGLEGGDTRAARFVFAGVSHTGTVFVDGKKVGGHHDAFTPWDVVVPGLAGGEHELAVYVDNAFGEQSALHKPNDYYTYGGITRPVELQLLPQVYLHRAAATPRAGRNGKWSLDVRVELRNWSRRALKRGVTVEVAGQVAELEPVTVPGRGEVAVVAKLTGLDVEPWSPDSPSLYFLETTLLDGDTPVDDLIDRVGFREVKVRGKKMLLNGQSVRLRGYNRHEDHPQFGNAIPVEAMIADLQILKDLGCNFVRTCHYPNDQRFLDLCDEMGFYVWEESHARSVDMDHPKFAEQIDASTREMVSWHHNHPSIIIWGILNECHSDKPEQKHHYERLLKIIKSADPSRPRSFATNRGDRDLCLELADIVSVNHYTGWYGQDLAGVEPAFKQFMKWLNSDASRGGKGKPVIVSEFGAGAIPGYRERHRAPWTEEYQCDVLDEELRVYLNHPQVVGAAVWQFCDVRVTPEKWWARRPRTMNNKGTVDQFRRPKLAYDTVRRRMYEAIGRWDGQ